MKKLIVIDGNSLLFRAYYATAYGPNPSIMRTKEGIPTNALFAFGNMINSIVTSFKGDEHIIVGFDAGKKTFRHEEDENYKANRKPCPEDLAIQMPAAREFLKSFGIFVYEQVGVEGDDICGTVAKNASKQGIKVEIYTSDRDFLQLIDDNITIKIIVKGMKDIRDMTPTTMVETYGFTPLQIIDFKGLRGDASDNLPGIPGVGEKTATTLIQKYQSFENIMAHAEEIGGKVGENLIQFKEQGEMCKRLATILTDVELPFTLDDLKYEGYRFKEINEFTTKYELKQLLNRLPSKFKIADESLTNLDTIEVNKLPEDFNPKYLNIAVDLSEGNYHHADFIGISVSCSNKSFYLSKTSLLNDKKLIELLKNPEIKKSCYDYKAIKVSLSKLGIEINGLDFDILLAAYLLDSSLNNDIDSIYNYFGIDLPKPAEASMTLFNEGTDKNIERVGKAAYSIEAKKNEILKSLDNVGASNLFKEIELPLSSVLSNLEIEGFPLDTKVLQEIGKGFKEKLDTITKEIYEIAGHEFNIASPKQVGTVLFDELKLPHKSSSTSVEVLTSLINDHPIISKILEYRKYAKLISTYIDAFVQHTMDDGKVHALFNQALTTTGRLSSSEPNLQNISARDEEGKTIRKAFYYKNDEYKILSLDYSQIELRILASISDCPSLIEIFNNDEDIHSATARKVFHIDGDVPDALRRKAKAVNFGIVYGISDWGLSDQLKIDISESKQIIKSFYESFPEVKAYLGKVVLNATNDGFVTTLSGRRRYLREIHDNNYQVREFAKRAAMNAPIQGTAADLIKIAMINVDKFLQENHYKTKMILQIHDELLFKVPSDEEFIINDLKNIMEHAMPLKVKLSVDGGYGHTWYDAK